MHVSQWINKVLPQQEKYINEHHKEKLQAMHNKFENTEQSIQNALYEWSQAFSEEQIGVALSLSILPRDGFTPVKFEEHRTEMWKANYYIHL